MFNGFHNMYHILPYIIPKVVTTYYNPHALEVLLRIFPSKHIYPAPIFINTGNDWSNGETVQKAE